jgi:hypothetical protein
MDKEILKSTIRVNNNHEIENYAYRQWMNEKSNISKAIYHLSKAVNYLLVWGDIEETAGSFNEYSLNLELFCNKISALQLELTEYVDSNPKILELDKSIVDRKDKF